VRRTRGVLKEAMINLNKTAKKMGCTINVQKTKNMEVTKKKKIKVGDKKYERVKHLKVFWICLTEDNNIPTVMKRRIVIAN
jgi:hypothetical protein